MNGSIYAAQNQELTPPAAGLVNQPPVKMDDPTYNAMAANSSRTRQGYNSSTMGSYGSTNWSNWSSSIFDTTGQIINNSISGAVIGDSTGIKAWSETSLNYNPPETVLDTTPTQQVVMPDLSKISFYEGLSQTYTDTKATYGDGTANPYYNQGAYVQTWNDALNSGAGRISDCEHERRCEWILLTRR